MSGSQNPFVNSSIKRLGKALETSNFAHTCNLLSQYVKDRGSIKDLNLLGICGKSEATANTQESKAGTSTLNLLDYIENSGQPSSQEQGKPVDPLVTSYNSDDATRKASPSKEEAAGEPKRAQMTIFYGGKVIVFDDFPADIAKEVMLLASSGAPENSNIFGSWNNNVDKICSGDAVASSSKAPVNPVSIAAQELPQPQPPQLEANTSELPIARRSSLHRFLAKRKDRAGAREPYQLHHNNNDNDRPESSSKNDQEQLELKLW